MKVFLSCSGVRSKKVADTFADWLPQVIQAVEPWISTDIAKGSRWNPEIGRELETSKIGIICLTQENLNEKWILFEAGALSKSVDTKVCTLLLGLNPTDIEPPLSQFQHTSFNKEDIFRLIQTINTQLEQSHEKPLAERTLTQVYERCWPELEERINKIIANSPKQKEQIRTDRDILEEILETLRKQDRRLSLTDTFVENKLIPNVKTKYYRLVNEFGVQDYEAMRSILNELKKEYGSAFTIDIHDKISEFLMDLSENDQK